MRAGLSDVLPNDVCKRRQMRSGFVLQTGVVQGLLRLLSHQARSLHEIRQTMRTRSSDDLLYGLFAAGTRILCTRTLRRLLRPLRGR